MGRKSKNADYEETEGAFTGGRAEMVTKTKRQAQEDVPRVGIFWLVEGKLVIDSHTTR